MSGKGKLRRAARGLQRSRLWLIAGVVVYLGVAISGVWVAAGSHEARQLFVQLERGQRVQDELLADYSRLLLERSMLSSFENVDQVAEHRLSMRFPEAVERVDQ
jgi:cell division protein FtsL